MKMNLYWKYIISIVGIEVDIEPHEKRQEFVTFFSTSFNGFDAQSIDRIGPMKELIYSYVVHIEQFT